MKSRHPTTILLDHTVDLMFEVYMLRGDCSAAAKALMQQKRLDEASLEDCARLDDTLAQVYRTLQATVKRIRESRARRGTRA